MTFRWAIALLPSLVFAQLDRVGPPNSGYALLKNRAAVDAGERRFRQLCSGCHGRNGEGGRAKDKVRT
jgi:mono/diheme cytochrome c family protein